MDIIDQCLSKLEYLIQILHVDTFVAYNICDYTKKYFYHLMFLKHYYPYIKILFLNIDNLEINSDELSFLKEYCDKVILQSNDKPFKILKNKINKERFYNDYDFIYAYKR